MRSCRTGLSAVVVALATAAVASAQPPPPPSKARNSRAPPATASAARFRLVNLRARYQADGGQASTGSSFR